MAKITRNFVKGRMNKVYDERVIPDGEYIDAMNIRMGSTEESEIGVIENTKGNLPLTSLTYIDGTPLSASARCIGAIENSVTETIYWFVHDSNFPVGATGKLDLIVSFNVSTNILTYHVISINDGGGVNTTLNFNSSYLITGVDILDNKLLFFTDDYNAPRVINVQKNYPNPITNVDEVSAESLLVIKKPPVEAPTVELTVVGGQENFLETRFICFAYRYKYENGEYSATSQWSAPAFIPKPFNFSVESFLNEGMTNSYNSAIITYNSGGPLVVGIDLLFKKADGNLIRVIEKLDKKNLGILDNEDMEYQFTNSKIFTVLSESELLRLYDNVPRFAKAQTIMGNRLMYGNYIEGYDLIDNVGSPVMFDYSIDLVSLPIGLKELDTSLGNGTYFYVPVTVPDSILEFDLAGQNLVAGSAISLDFRINHVSFSSVVPVPNPPEQENNNIDLNFSFFLLKNYSSVYELATSVEFQDAIGTTANIQPINNACNGTTFTDTFNCVLQNNLDDFVKSGSGITFVGQPFGIITSPASNVIGLQVPFMQYVNSVIIPNETVYELFDISSASATFQEVANTQSLHSNRDYEIGIVYMDDFNRASTALVSENNNIHISCGKSALQNSIQVTIPPTQRPPIWATRYKFVIKPDQENYETIYSSIFFTDIFSNDTYFLLEGENSRKVEAGDRLIVKADSNGPTQTCVYATVLEKSSQASGFIEIPSELNPEEFINVPAGVYVKINANSFSAVQNEQSVIAPGKVEVYVDKKGTYPILSYPMNQAGVDEDNPSFGYVDYPVPSGSRITFDLKFQRLGPGDGDKVCERRIYTLVKTFVSSADYDNMMDWFNGDNIAIFLNEGIQDVGGNGCDVENEYIETELSASSLPASPFSPDQPSECTNLYRFFRNTSSNQLSLLISGTERCDGVGSGDKRRSSITANIQVFEANNVIIFETEPSEALPDVFFENNMSFAIVNGNHEGNVQNQNINAGIPAIVDTKFFNCFSFGNGAESYKIRDSIVGTTFNFGNRVTSVSAQDYKAADRFADITYSGVYSAESNVNKLNEFNLGLLNYKVLEPSFGDIYILDGRETDILVLQEDKISYVLASKNLISDSTGGGVISSVPEVLGTQIARTEKYGISFNPESYVHWGFNRFFTDIKRGAVIQLVGSSTGNDQLAVISELGMRTWFRDEFNRSYSTQKLGGFDPYMNEYVLSTNDIQIPSNPECLACGISQTFTLSTLPSVSKTFEYCVDLGAVIGTSDINYTVETISAGASFEITVDYDGTSYTTGVETTSGTLTFTKDNISVETATITIDYTGDIVLSVLAECTVTTSLTIVQVVVTNNFEAEQTIHTQYRYTDNTFTSPLQSVLTTFLSSDENPLVSRYSALTGPVGSGAFPPATSTLRIIANKLSTDTFVFNPATDKFKYLMSNTLYANTTANISTLLGLATTATPNQGSGNINYAEFTVPALQDYLYLIWDFRDSTSVTLCYSDATLIDVCCGCEVV
jgi:hypothetical protein